MLATGASLIEALKDLLNHGTPSQLHIVAVIASKQGVETLSNAFPDAHIWVGAIDENLTQRLYFSRIRRCWRFVLRTKITEIITTNQKPSPKHSLHSLDFSKFPKQWRLLYFLW